MNDIRIHKVDDGLGKRRVYDSGVEVEGCVYVDLERGVYHFIPENPRPVMTLLGETIEVERRFSNDIKVEFCK